MSLPVGIQLYSVREDAKKDLYGTLKAIKEMGYQGVEFAGLYDHPADEVRGMLDELGLVSVSSHVPLAKMQEDMDTQIRDCKTIGNRFIVVPYLASEMRDGEAFYTVVKEIERLAIMAKAAGLQMLYHNHDFEFLKIGDEYKLDYLYEHVDADLLKTQLDTCWVNVGGENPVQYINKYHDRAPLVHLKDFVGKKTEHMYELIGTKEATVKDEGIFELRPVGYGCQDFYGILNACEKADTEWVIVEQDHTTMGKTALESAKMSRNYLKTLGY